MIVPRPVLLLLEEAVAGVLALDPELPRALAPLQGTVLAVTVEGLGLTVYLEVTEGGLRLHERPPAPPQAHLRGLPSALLRLARGTPPAASGVRLQGDVGRIQRLAEILAGADLDWEETLARYTGDLLAHPLGRTLRGLGGWLAHARRQLALDGAEYLREEAALVADRPAVEAWSGAVDELREAEARLRARIERLERRLSSRGRAA